MVTTIDNLSSQHDWDIVKTFYSYYQNYDPFFYQKIVSQPEKTEDISGKTSPELEYQCKPTELVMVDILNPPDILLQSISIYEQNNGSENKVYFYHGDHLGSANGWTSTPTIWSILRKANGKCHWLFALVKAPSGMPTGL